MLLFISGAIVALAQTGEITGRITDPTGAIVPSADVAVTNVDTGVSRQVKSNESGYYSAPLLPTGNYQ
ncbi:MAG: carboxypeptidase-like regulatory domain-containing protein, partial [Bryobacteraceae bacterium]